ncbi:MAG: hypothetical protein CM15mP120_09430 [Pseudomonadota bacterium]|nr:MAG: hypothetical protein CM15mP120_09430 [Pseudomonadota bacterium]
MADTNIGVSVLCPHVVDTPIIDALRAKVSDKVAQIIDDMAVPADTVGEQVKRAILTDEFYIFCDGTHTRKCSSSVVPICSPRWIDSFRSQLNRHRGSNGFITETSSPLATVARHASRQMGACQPGVERQTSCSRRLRGQHRLQPATASL